MERRERPARLSGPRAAPVLAFPERRAGLGHSLSSASEADGGGVRCREGICLPAAPCSTQHLRNAFSVTKQPFDLHL